MADKKLRVTLVKSPIRYSMRQKRTVQSLGLRHLQASVEIYDTPVNRGKITAVRHLVEVEEIDSNA
jgi:large subunit ribosomal protein L30